MALTNKEQSLIDLIQSSSAQSFGAMNEGSRKAVRKAYSDPLDNGEFCKVVFSSVKNRYKAEVARFFKRCGINVTMDGVNSVIGGVLDRSKQNDVLSGLDDRIAVSDDVQHKNANKPPVELLASESEKRARQAAGRTIARLKKNGDDAAAAWLNDLVSKADVQPAKPAPNPLGELQLDASEIKAVLEYVTFLRTVNFDANEDELILKAA